MTDSVRTYALGERVSVLDGPFENFEAIVLAIEPEQERLTVGVTVAGRQYPIHTEHWQVRKLAA
jgi:transcriptional antiterminator NusG